MADKKISELDEADALTGAELIAIVQDGFTRQATLLAIKDLGLAAAPDAFAEDNWSVARGNAMAAVTIAALPADNGATITDVEYRVDSGSWVSSGGTAGFDMTGLTNGVAYDIELRAVNAVGASNASDTKSVTPATVPSAFGAGAWSLAAGHQKADIAIGSLPANGGSTITGIEYRLDGGSWISSGGVSSFTITGLTNDTEYDVELRALNSVGAGAASDTKSVTPGWTPLNLGAKLRAWWDYTDTANLWQNTDATGSVSADTDPVGRVSDKSGNGKHLIQATSGLKPAYRTSAPRVRFDGSNDYLAVASAAFPLDAFELFQVVQQHATGANDDRLYSFARSGIDADWNSTSALIMTLGNASNLLEMYANTANLQAVYAGSGLLPKGLYETSKTTSVASINVNGANVATDSSFTALGSTHNGSFLDGARKENQGSTTVAGGTAIDRFETIMTAALTSDERTALRDYLYARHGITP